MDNYRSNHIDNSYAEKREDDTKNARAIDGIKPAYNPRIPLVSSKFLAILKADLGLSVSKFLPWMFALTQSRGKDMNHPVAPLMPPAKGTAIDEGKTPDNLAFKFS